MTAADQQSRAGAPRPSQAAEQQVSSAMRPGVITCPPDAELRAVAATMAHERIHCLVVAGEGDRPWGPPLTVISDIDVARAIGADPDRATAGELAATEAVTVGPTETLARAAQLMAEHEVSHLLVADPGSAKPLGVLSTLDLAGYVAWGNRRA